MGAIHVHEFMSLDGAIDAPTWTFEYGFRSLRDEADGDLYLAYRPQATAGADERSAR